MSGCLDFRKSDFMPPEAVFEELDDFCDLSPLCETEEWFPHASQRPRWESGKINSVLHAIRQEISRTVLEEADGVAEHSRTVEEKFRELAEQWSNETWHVSSLSDLATHPSYRKIIELGDPVVRYLLSDLITTHRFWFPALAEITKLRPFDPKDAGNVDRMSDAWIRWGRKKGLI
jgi:hypothetical protein